jgi:hypothetical protein
VKIILEDYLIGAENGLFQEKISDKIIKLNPSGKE